MKITKIFCETYKEARLEEANHLYLTAFLYKKRPDLILFRDYKYFSWQKGRDFNVQWIIET